MGWPIPSRRISHPAIDGRGLLATALHSTGGKKGRFVFREWPGYSVGGYVIRAYSPEWNALLHTSGTRDTTYSM